MNWYDGVAALGGVLLAVAFVSSPLVLNAEGLRERDKRKQLRRQRRAARAVEPPNGDPR